MPMQADSRVSANSNTSGPSDCPAIGPLLKHLRKHKGYSLAELATAAGLSEATLSRIENGRTLVSAPHLYQLAQILDADISSFFAPDARPMASGIRSVARAGGTEPVLTDRFATTVLCADLSQKAMHPFLNEITARSLEEAGGLKAHRGEEFLHVIAGTIVLHSEFYAPLTLAAGDSLYFDAGMPHAYLNTESEPAHILVVTTFGPPHRAPEPRSAYQGKEP
ncbi:MAG: XRE family transcriptional regulator [Pseudomonadota bacterium]